jgi:hypothetical protein
MDENQPQTNTQADNSTAPKTTTVIIENVLHTLQQRLAEAIGANLSFAPLSEITLELTAKDKEKEKTKKVHFKSMKDDIFRFFRILNNNNCNT